jgi:hypothetical protein
MTMMMMTTTMTIKVFICSGACEYRFDNSYFWWIEVQGRSPKKEFSIDADYRQ